MPKLTDQRHTPETLKRIASRLRELAEAADAVSIAMASYGLESMRVVNQRSLTDGLDGIGKFTHAAAKAFEAYLKEIGAYGVDADYPASLASPTSENVPKTRQKRGTPAKKRQDSSGTHSING